MSEEVMEKEVMEKEVDREVDRKKRFCFALFGKTKTCENVKCIYNHNVDEYLEYFNLKTCPNNCGNFCKKVSNSCSKCVTKWIEQRSYNESRSDSRSGFLQKSFLSDIEPKKCASENCSEITKYYLCRQCNEIKRVSISKK
jgi:hypothetical protein